MGLWGAGGVLFDAGGFWLFVWLGLRERGGVVQYSVIIFAIGLMVSF